GDDTTRTFRQRSGQTSWGTRNMVSVSGTTSTSASTGTLGGILGLLQSWNRTAVERGFISSALSGPEIVQLLIATASDIDPSDYTSVPNAWPTQVGWDLQTGYGRINARRFQEELRLGHIRPVAWFDRPAWFALYDPTRQSKVEIFGHTEARRPPGGPYGWAPEWAPGAEPADAAVPPLAPDRAPRQAGRPDSPRRAPLATTAPRRAARASRPSPTPPGSAGCRSSSATPTATSTPSPRRPGPRFPAFRSRPTRPSS